MVCRMALGFDSIFYIISVPDRLEAQRDIKVQGGGEVIACDDLERDMFNTLQAGNDGAAKLEGSGVGQGDEDVERTLRVVGGHREWWKRRVVWR
jgi:hypothetical protein